MRNVLLHVAKAPDQQAQADHAVADDHYRRIDGIAGDGSAELAVRQHHGENQGGLDDRNGQRKDECAEWLAYAVRDDLGMVHCADDRTQQCRDG